MFAILADIHANLEALSAVLEDIKQRGPVEEFWCLGDTVGYGPDPHECLEVLRGLKHVSVAGNHDWAAIGRIDITRFNNAAAVAARWTAQQLTPGDVSYLDGLPLTVEKGDFTLAHGSPREPLWEYMLSARVARENLAYFKSRYCLVGHSHIPLAYPEAPDGERAVLPDNYEVALGQGRLILNPGGVGQPRDGDPRASYALYEPARGRFTVHRVLYDVTAVQARMRRVRLPVRLIERLSRGV